MVTAFSVRDDSENSCVRCSNTNNVHGIIDMNFRFFNRFSFINLLLIYLKENIFAGSDTFLGSDITDSDGRYSITWIADAPGTRPIFSVFEGSFSYSDARSEVQIQVEEETPQDQPAEMQYHSTEISIPVSSETAYEGDIIVINGKLSDDGNAVANAHLH